VDTHQSCIRSIVAFMLAIGSVMGANAVIVIRFAPIRHSIGGVTAPIALAMPAIVAIRRRVVSIVGCSARFMDGGGLVVARTGRVVARIASVKFRSGLNMGRIGSFMRATLSVVRGTVSVIPRTVLVT
jgi:hypothetical protein